jgi:nucleoid DNA-binding protein
MSNNIYGQTLLDDMVRTQALPMPLVRQAAQEILAVIREGLVRDSVVNVSNFGTFRLKLAAARQGYNPQTRERITIPAHQRVIFSPCKALRELIQPVHPQVVPIRPELKTTRAAARSAAIATAPVTSRRIEPNTPQPQTVLTGQDTTETPPQAAPLTSPPPTPIPANAVTPPAVVTTPPSARPVVAEPLAVLMAENEGHGESSADSLSLEIDELRKEAATKVESKKVYYLGAAAVLVIAVVSATLLRDPSTEVKSNTATTQQPVVAAPLMLPVTTPPVEEIDSSALYTELVNATPVEEPDRTNAKSSEATTPANAGEVEILPTTAKTTTLHKPLNQPIFFTEQSHQVTNGESLWRLAREHYRQPLLWPHIYQANAALIDNPDQLRAGTTIVIPSLQGAPEALSKTDRRNIAEGYYLTYLHYKKIGHKEAFFALLEAKRYDNKVVEEHSGLLQLSKVEEILLRHQQTMPF